MSGPTSNIAIVSSSGAKIKEKKEEIHLHRSIHLATRKRQRSDKMQSHLLPVRLLGSVFINGMRRSSRLLAKIGLRG